jgi:ornithine cyclodeaminase/alanine dehydrogenase-like protein (mu-crystallin family)
MSGAPRARRSGARGFGEAALTIIITDQDVARLTTMEECVAAMRTAFEDFSRGDAVNRPRLRYLARHPDPELRYMANVHAGATPSTGVACVRAGSQILRPQSARNDRRVYENPSAFNWGVVILYSLETAEPLAFLHEFHLSGMRVGATTGAAVDKMARRDASTLCLFGTGKQARAAYEAILAVRPVVEARVHSPNPAQRAAFAEFAQRQGVAVRVLEDPREAMRGADIVCCATNASRPVFDGDWLEDGQFVATIANSDATNKRSEVDETVFRRASAIVVNDWESVEENAQSELLDPIARGAVKRGNVHELGDVFLDKADVRQPPRGAPGAGVVYYKNNSGLAIQFAAAGGLILRKALVEGVCKSISTEWFGSDLSEYHAAGFRPSP